jgi:23S rRNA-intervening sequence protein
MASSSFRELRVWQEAMKLASEIYKSTANFPKHEIYGLSQQMRRAACPYRAISRKEKVIILTKSLHISCFTRAARSWSCKLN